MPTHWKPPASCWEVWTVPLTEYQQAFLRNCSHRWNIKTGATRSGKTYLDCAVTIPQRILAARDEGLCVMLGNTLGTLERNVLEPMRALWGPDLVGVVRTSASGNIVQLFGRKVYVLGADNKKHIARIQGAAFEYAYGDEITTWDEGVFQMLKSRLSCPHSHFDGTCNPDNPQHWFKKFLDSDADIYCQAYTIDDNPTLPPEFVAQLKKEYTGTVYYNRFILGQWAMADGLVYPFFSAKPDAYLFQGDTSGIDGQFYVSIDYGTHNPCSMGLWVIHDGKALRIRESYFDSREMRVQRTDEEHYAELERLTKGYYIQAVVVDPSAASFIETIRRHGRYQVMPANNDVLNGIRCVASMMQAGLVTIHESCAASRREFGAYCWDDKAKEDRVVKENDHAMDDIRYFCYTILAPLIRWADWRKQ